MAAVSTDPLLKTTGGTHTTSRIIAAQEVALLFNQAYVGIPAVWIASLLFAIVLWPVVSHTKILSWLALFSLVSVGRLLLARMFHKSDATPDKYPRWRDRAVIASGLAGITWGLAGTLLFPVDSIPHQMFLGCMLAGVIAGSIPFMSAVWPSYIAHLVPIAVPYSIRLIQEPLPVAQTMALLMLLFAAVMLYASWKMHRTLSESLRLRYDKQVLAECLGQTADELDIANAVREQAKRVARESERRVQILADAPFEGILIHERGKILDANRTLLDMFGLSLEDAMGKRVLDFIPPDARDQVSQELENPRSEVFITYASRSNGEKLKLEVRGRHFPAQGRTVRVVSMRPVD